MRRVLSCSWLLALSSGCASADPGSLAVPVDTVEVEAVSAQPATRSDDPPKPPLERPTPAATVASSGDVPPLPPLPGPLQVGPAPAGPAPPVASSTTKPATASDLARLEPALDAAVARDAPGMVLDGGTMAGRFVQGDVLERVLMIQPGHCYSVVAVSQGGITELDVALVAGLAPMMPPMPLAIDSDQGPAATLGRAPSCFKSPLPIPMPVLVRATAKTGSGAAAFRVLSK